MKKVSALRAPLSSNLFRLTVANWLGVCLMSTLTLLLHFCSMATAYTGMPSLRSETANPSSRFISWELSKPSLTIRPMTALSSAPFSAPSPKRCRKADRDEEVKN